jgi:tRNA-specific 2-thiouridylase
MLRPELLSKLCFPLGDSTKAEVRAQALELGLPGATKGESQELCFVPSGRYTSFVAERAGARIRPGPILGDAGQLLGEHQGLHAFTIGQRRNLGVALGRRAYVVGIDPATASVQLGEREQLLSSGALLGEVYLAPDVDLPLTCEAQVRYRAEPVPASVVAHEKGLELVFDRPVMAVVPGQYAVFFDGDRVLGGGVIRAALGAAQRRAG